MSFSNKDLNLSSDKEYPYDANYSRFPKMITCPSCNKQGITKIRGETGATALAVSCVAFTLTL